MVPASADAVDSPDPSDDDAPDSDSAGHGAGHGAEHSVSWDLTTGTDPLSTAVLLAGVGLVVGLPVGAVVLGGTVLAAVSVLGGEYALLAGLAAVVVLAVAIGRAEFTAVRLAATREDDGSVGLRRTLIAVLCGGVVHAVVVAVAGGIAYNYAVVGLGIATIASAGALAGEGTVDPDAGSVEYRGDAFPLAAVRSVRTVVVGDRVLVVPRYRGGVPRASRAVTFSQEAYAAAEPLLDAVSRGETDSLAATDPPERLPRAVRATATALAIGMAGIGVAVHLLAPPELGGLVLVLLAAESPVVAVLAWYAYAG